MEGHIARTRKRVHRKVTVGQRISRLIEAPHLSRSQRLQRRVIVTMALLMGVYLIVWPIFSDMFGGGRREAAAPTASGAPNSTSPPLHALGKKR
jgi:hypothetical protein